MNSPTIHPVKLCSLVFTLLCANVSFAEDKPNSVLYRAQSTDIPYENQATNSAWEHLEFDQNRYDSPYSIALFNPEDGEDGGRLWSQTKSIAAYGFGIAGILAIMPEDITNWDNEGGDIFKKWGDNVSEVITWDRDVWYINYIGHPYFGGVYYQSARKSGYRQWDSFVYSFMMSTFYWEYGVEAFAEVPALQDIVVTPVLGWVVGEWAFQKEQKILQNDGKVWNSTGMGSTAMFFLDPVDTIGGWVNKLAKRQIVQAGTGYIKYEDVPTGPIADGNTSKMFRVGVTYTINQHSVPLTPQKRYRSTTGDPVDTGIVGVSLGAGHVSLDDDWGFDSGPASDWSLGLYFNKRVSARLRYTHAQLDNEFTGETETYENYNVDMQYYFNSESNTRPFISGGVGEQIFDKDRDRKNVIWNAGLGVHHQFTPKWAMQADYIAFYSPSQHTTEQLANVRLLYRFGAGENPALH